MNELDKLYEKLKEADDENIMEIYQLIKEIERGRGNEKEETYNPLQSGTDTGNEKESRGKIIE